MRAEPLRKHRRLLAPGWHSWVPPPGKALEVFPVFLPTMGSTRALSHRPVPGLQRQTRMQGLCMTQSILPWFPAEGPSALLSASHRTSW